jgi:hypothetical protein
MLENILDFVRQLADQPARTLVSPIRRLDRGRRSVPLFETTDIGDIYCSQCGDRRRVRLAPVSVADFDMRLVYEEPGPERVFGGAELTRKELVEADIQRLALALVPSLFKLNCVQCDAGFTAVIYQSPDGAGLAILPAVTGGLRTPHTPEAVAYYLDQAQRSRSVGANSAAVAMYRVALDQLLLLHGYDQRMCGQKLQALEADISAGKAPKWAMDLDTEFLTVLKSLGDGALHAGDVAKQSHLDSDLLDDATDTILHLLFVVYEAEHEKNSKLSRLKAKVAAIKK